MNIKSRLISFILGVVVASSVNAGIPTFDGVNLVQNIMTVIEETSQTIQQVQEYRTQLEQYQNMLQNTMAPAMNIWDDARRTMNNLRSAIDTLNYYKNQLGSLDNYLQKFGDLDYYLNSPCFNGSGNCSATELARLKETKLLGYESQQEANRALFRGLDQQQEALESDARQLERLQAAATGASGQVEAIGYANQLASQQANQLLQIRGLLIAQQNSVTTRMQAQMDEEAKQEAADQQFMRRNYSDSTGRTW
ncbi:MAG: P-type conjugative transfer protein TrbJ [Candidatus Thiodiazotropha sp. (ex Dulcina madagascariensis)]|nr:P-type conjugative transfer protein TrbJ [Candidatus Thiodiazotropha sp. (ex Dulcina madagascariensis)]